jgi:hypothetical protein
MHVHATSLSFVVKARICIQQKGDQKKLTGRRTRQGHENNYISLPCQDFRSHQGGIAPHPQLAKLSREQR